jgi:serine/threonine protein kinase
MSKNVDEAKACSVCGTALSGVDESCPVCMLRKGLAGGFESGESSKSEEMIKATPEEVAQRFEHYALVTGEDGTPVELGRGAMGVTYKAFDVDLRCLVALKVISERYLGDESAQLRFLREARAAARLRHSNVASVLHLGRTRSSYFYAMEFVEGETLESLIKRSGRLEVKLALEIATQVAAGLAAVHKQKLVHRDIKPSNIMVNLEEGSTVTVKIIDLGLAKPAPDAPAETAISTPEAFAGTPEFASPEQFAGVAVDIRSDLYSLGVVLWEMVTGHAVFRGFPAEVMYQHQHAPLPIEKLEHVPQPLLVLIEVLLEKDPGRRFQNPADLLNALPKVTEAVKARHTITRQSLREIAAQRPGASGKAIQILTNIRDVVAVRSVRLVLWPALVLVSVALSIWLLQSQQHSNEQLLALQQKFEKLEQGVNSFAEVQNKVRQEQPGQKPEQLEQTTYDVLGKQLGIDPVTLHNQLPRFAQELKQAPHITAYQRANAAYVAKDYNEAERLALVAADQAQHGSPPNNGETIKAFELAGWSAEKRIEYADALSRLREAEKLTDRTRTPLEWARVQFAIAFVLYDQGQYREAERLFREVLKEREQILGPVDADTLTTRRDLESALFYEGKYTEAEAEARALLVLHEKIFGPEHPDTLKARNNLAADLFAEGMYAEAETEFRAVLKLKEKALGPEHPDTLSTRSNLAGALVMQGKYAGAESELRATIKLEEKVLGPEHPETLSTRSNLAEVLDNLGKYAEAAAEDRAVLKLDEKVLGPEHPDSLNTRNNLALTLLHQGKYAEAETEDREAIKLDGRVLGLEHPYTLDTRNNLAKALEEQGKYTEAESEYRAVIQLREKVLGVEHPDTLQTCSNLAGCLRAEAKMQEAKAFAQRAAEGAQKVLGPEHPDTKKYEQLLRELLAKEG